ncbi:MAG: aquaporin, partial [Pseudomonadota bacterium]
MAQNAGATARELVGEAVGTVLLLAGIIGSGILAQELSGELTGLALFMHAASVGGLLVVLVLALGPVSGAHFNPAVTIAFWMDGKVSAAKAAAYIAVQVIAALIGVAVAHLSFNLDPFIPGVQARTGTGVWIGEVVATFSLVFAIFMIVRVNVQS